MKTNLNKVDSVESVEPVFVEEIQNDTDEEMFTLVQRKPQPEKKPKKRLGYKFVKRAFDICMSSLLIVLLSPTLLLCALMIACTSGAPVSYKCTRVGKGGKKFKMLKFRTMRKNADKLEDFLTPEQLEEYKKNYKLEKDPRITKIGNILRKTSLDELPQLFNIFVGDMSFVGPRPVLQEETELYGEEREKLLSVRPGLTGYWQAYARNDVGYEDCERQKMELHYIDCCSVWFDIKIAFKTVGTVLSRKGAK